MSVKASSSVSVSTLSARASPSSSLTGRPENYPELIEPYRNAADAADISLVVRYTELLTRKLRWTCVQYTRSKPKNPKKKPRGEWSAANTVYGEE